MISAARRIYRAKEGRGAPFENEIPEELIADRLMELWERKDALEMLLTDPDSAARAGDLMAELAEIEEVLGLRQDGDPIRTGDELTDYLYARQLAGTITPEDLDLTPQQFRRMKREGRTHG